MNLDVDLTANKVSDTQWKITGSISDIPVDVLTSDLFTALAALENDSGYGAIRNTLNLVVDKLKRGKSQ